MRSFPKQIRNFIICVATIASGIAFSGMGTTVPVSPGVLTEVVITSKKTEKLLATYIYFQNSGVKNSVDFAQHSFFILLKNYNSRTSVSIKVHQKLSQNLKSQMQQLVLRISATTAYPSEEIS